MKKEKNKVRCEKENLKCEILEVYDMLYKNGFILAIRNFVFMEKNTNKTPDSHQPNLLFFADAEPSYENNSIYKYLSDAGFTPEEVKQWGKIGSLTEALKESEQQVDPDPNLYQNFIEFVKKLPPGNTPKPQIRHQMQRTPPL